MKLLIYPISCIVSDCRAPLNNWASQYTNTDWFWFWLPHACKHDIASRLVHTLVAPDSCMCQHLILCKWKCWRHQTWIWLLLYVVLCRVPVGTSTIVLPSLRVQVLVPTGGMLKLCRTAFLLLLPCGVTFCALWWHAQTLPHRFSASYEPHAYLMHYKFIHT